jgi:hypothetical protein
MAEAEKPTPSEKPPGYTFGRPTLYKQEYCQQLIDHMAKGYSFEAFGGVVGVARDRVYEWAKKHPDFAEAKEIGLAQNLMYFEKQGNMGLWEDKDGPKLNNTLWVFNMKNRHGWTDRKDVQVKASVETKNEVKKLSTEQLIELAKHTVKITE